MRVSSKFLKSTGHRRCPSLSTPLTMFLLLLLKQRFVGGKSGKIVFTEGLGAKGLPQESESKKIQGVEEKLKISFFCFSQLRIGKLVMVAYS